MALPQPSVAQLRPALQLALDMAATSPPGRQLPGRVRSLVRARRKPANWAVTMVQALDDDEAFRSWVAGEAAEEDIGRVAWLWLTRPDGWAEEVAGLLEEAAASEEMDKELRLTSERAAALERQLAAAREELTAARTARSELEAEVERQRRAAARHDAERRAEAESALAGRDETIGALVTARSALEAERDALLARIGGLEGDLAEAERARTDAQTRASQLAQQVAALEREREGLRREEESRRSSVSGAIGLAASAAAELGSALAAAAQALSPRPGAPGPEGATRPAARSGPGGGGGGGRDTGERDGAGVVASGGSSGVPAARASAGEGGVPAAGASGAGPAAPAAGRETGRGRGRGAVRVRPPGLPSRRAVALPLGVFEDSSEAAAFLVRVAGVHIVVDGYNVALTSWAESTVGRPPVPDLPALRRRLLDALSELVIRVQRTVTVVFDGADEGGRVAATGAARPWLRILFSASHVEADQLILEAVRGIPSEVPVVVATNDREVRDGARRLGANILSVGQLLAVLNRHTPM